ncbi:hypothetical protein [Pedobacter ureilyticus]|uniref:hypothetical protein n=1 Tax=Pedobacter ureilyticus TaxID=1393051 RepID=UPI0038FCC34C
MKYHYMHISTTCVRIELIPEDTEEKLLLQKLAQADPQDPTLENFFRKAIRHLSS